MSRSRSRSSPHVIQLCKETPILIFKGNGEDPNAGRESSKVEKKYERGSEKDGESGSFSTTVEDLMNTSRYPEIDRSKGKETTKKKSVNRPSPDVPRRQKSGSRQYVSRSPSRSPSSSRSRSLPAMRSKSKNRRHTSRISSMPKQTRVISEQQFLPQEGIDIEFKSLSLTAEDELSNRHRNGEIYDDVSANLRSIKKRLKHLSENNASTFSIDEAIEISDAAFLLKILRKPNAEIELGGQLAYRGAVLLLQADLLKKKGHELLDQCKHRLRMADL